MYYPEQCVKSLNGPASVSLAVIPFTS
uniref:Uncharacterized protein n=1 Tax=Arundo donax TaxID=35708 RepID=A0A0A9AJA3_ARUDO